MGASAREQQVPAQRGGEQFKRPAARPERQLAAGKQQAELIFGGHVHAHKVPLEMAERSGHFRPPHPEMKREQAQGQTDQAKQGQ